MTYTKIEDLDEKLSRLMDNTIDSITDLQNMVADIKREQHCAPTISKKKTIESIDLGWQKGYDDNCICLTFNDGFSEVVEFDLETPRTLFYTFAPEIKITLNAQKIHSRTLMDLLKMLTKKNNYTITKYDYDNRSITLFNKNNMP